jgi:hypothetical protein
MKGFPSLQVRLLYQILRRRSIANQMDCGSIQIVHVRQCSSFKVSNLSFFAR